jgi:hypothetical protein
VLVIPPKFWPPIVWILFLKLLMRLVLSQEVPGFLFQYCSAFRADFESFHVIRNVIIPLLIV